MNKGLLIVISSTAGVVLVASGSLAQASHSRTPLKYKANLTPRAEVPAPKSASIRAGGEFKATLSGSSLSWRLTYKHLTGSATAAHIHLGAKGKAGPVIVALCAPCSSGASGTAKLSSKVASELGGGQAYVNVHTGQNPAGEIRGQIGR